MDVMLNISPVVLLRIPAFPLCDELVEVWEDLKGAIYHSSSDFYERIKDVPAAGITDLDTRTQYTIWKYYNRSKYRGTPFGNFAGFALTGLGEVQENVVFSKEQHLHRFKDWSRYKSVELHEKELNASDRLYFSNSSHYTVADHIRFISLGDQAFELSEVVYSGFIQELLMLCAEKASYPSVLEFAAKNAVTEEVLLGILKAMVDVQLLFTELNANIIGPDYFARIQKECHQNEQDDYLISERKMISGQFSKAVLKHLPSCINALLSLNLIKVNEGLKKFVKDFQKRYEGQEVPLLRILDPELGIGYGQFTSAAKAYDLAQELSSHSGKSGPTMLPWIAFSTELLKAILKDKPAVLQLKDLMKTKAQEADLKPANSFSILARCADDLLVLDNVGGCTANALSGRFTLASETLTRHCKSIATAESNANPEVIFFDLAYMAEGRVDNINRRNQIYEHELPILNYSCSEQLIALQDILVTVKGEEVILFSKKYGKRLIPRLASAYNYTRSDLSVYRFLCDLQHQGIQSQLLFDVQELLPGLDHYPRIQYENLVLSAAKWRIKGVELKGKDTLELLNQLGVCRYFSVGEGDQTLCFDQTKYEDISFLKQYANQYDDFVITEVIVPDSQVFVDVNKKSYFTQILLSIGHQEQLYPGYISNGAADESEIETVIMPGKDWLSYEVYCHPDRCEFLLSTRISAFITEHAAAFKTWFFVRYNDPSPHLRLRFQLKDQQTGYFYMTRLMELFEADLQEGLIKDVQLKTYYREIARYGAQQIVQTEQHFGKDSEYALEVVARHLDSFSIYANCIGLMKAALGLLSLEKKEVLTFIKGIQRSFEKEHELRSDDFKMVNREWLNFKGLIQSNEPAMALRLQELEQSFLHTLRATPAGQRPSLFCSLFHMHINRLFSEQQRAHELIIYSFLYKQLQMEQQRLVVA